MEIRRLRAREREQWQPSRSSARRSKRRGITRQPVSDPTPMLRCLDPLALARRLGTAASQAESESESGSESEDGEALLRRILPPERFSYWPADRF